MAAIVQHSQEESAARQFWNTQMGKHPNWQGWLAIAGEVAGFFLNGHFLVKLGQWVIRVAGYIAETALLFAVLWISGTSVAPHLVELVMSAQTMQYFVSVALIALALIPEIILANAIVNALGHIHTASQQRTPVAWAWAILFTFPMLFFLGLTAYTLNVLVQSGGNFMQASTGLVGLRCFAGWTYGLLEMVYAGVGRRMLAQMQVVVPPIMQTVPVQAPIVQPAPVQIDHAEIAHQLLPLIAEQIHPGGQEEIRAMVQSQTHLILEEVGVQLKTFQEHIQGQLDTLKLETPGETEEEEEEDEMETPDSTEEEDTPPSDVEEEEAYPLPRPRITAKLTDETKPLKKRASSNGRKTAQERAQGIVRRSPKISAKQLAERAEITPQYAYRILNNLRASSKQKEVDPYH